jgi:hypothetical protein
MAHTRSQDLEAHFNTLQSNLNGGNGEKLLCQGYIAWTHFVVEIYECFDTDTNHLGRLTKLKQSGTVEDFIASFERLDFRTEGMFDAFFRECFISGLKDDIRAHVLMARPQSWVEATKRDKEAQQVVSSQNRKPSFIPHTKPVNPTTHFVLGFFDDILIYRKTWTYHLLASEVTPGLLSGAEPDTHQFNVTVVKFGDQMEINSTMRFQL